MRLGNRLLALAALASVSSFAPGALAQTWVSSQTRPYLGELVALDATGEPDWIFGAEDVAGDGESFEVPEQSIDLRSAYATTAPSKLWVRAYVSSADAVGANVALHVFVNADLDVTTGGLADDGVDPAFTEDPTEGGYEYAFAVRGDGTIAAIWTWNDGPGTWSADTNVNPSEATGESAVDVDPILAGADVHAYLQATINLDRLGLLESCDASFYFRTLDADTGDGDKDAGLVSPCHPTDADGDGVPDIVVPPDGCVDDEDCPFNGVCIGGDCVFTTPCNDDGDCNADETCNEGLCVATPGGACSDNADCAGLVCDGETCVPCATGADACGAGFVCAPDGRCIDEGGGPGQGGGFPLDPGDVIRGGPCACRTAGERGGPVRWLTAVLALALAGARRSSRGGDRE